MVCGFISTSNRADSFEKHVLTLCDGFEMELITIVMRTIEPFTGWSLTAIVARYISKNLRVQSQENEEEAHSKPGKEHLGTSGNTLHNLNGTDTENIRNPFQLDFEPTSSQRRKRRKPTEQRHTFSLV